MSRALVASVIAHVMLVFAILHWLKPAEDHDDELVDIELAPPPLKAEALPEEVAKPLEPATPAKDEEPTPAASTPPEPAPGEALADAGVDAPIDAALVAKHDAGRDAAPQIAAGDAAAIDAAQLALGDGGAGDAPQIAAEDGTGDGGVIAAGSNGSGVALGSGVGSGIGSGSGEGSGVPAAIALGSGSGAPGMDDQPAIDGPPTSAGTAANLLAYFPPGHVITVLVRFDRLRGTEWAPAAEQLFRPMPDYQGLFGTKSAGLADKLDMLVISSPRPRDATATTLVMHTPKSRAQIRDMLASQPIAWSATKGGMFGKRSGKLFPGDTRVLLSPWQGWFVLAPSADLAGTTGAATGNIDAIEAKAKLPGWLTAVRTIDKESGGADKRGPALVMTVGEPPSGTSPSKSGRYKLPEVGVGVTSLPVPKRISLAMELVKQGWLVRGNIVFANEADAAELVTTLTDAQTRITDSHVLSGLLKKQHVYDVVAGLSLLRSGARVSYATSISILDARAVLAAVAATLGEYFNAP